MRVALILDNPKRDMDGLALVALHLLRHGVHTFITPMYQQGYDLPLLAPDLVLVNYARRNNKELLEKYKTLGIRIAVMDTEGGVLSEDGADSPVRWAEVFCREGFSDLIDRYFFWGTRLYRAFCSKSGLSPDALRVTGCPRYDVCVSPWRSVLKYSQRDYVLVNTNFSAINPAFTRSEDDEKKIFISLGWDPAYVEKLFEDMKAVFPRYLEQIVKLAADNPRQDFIIRPHPFEDPFPYQRRFSGLKNVSVSEEGNVLNVIANAACVVHLNCGSAVESNLLGKVPISMEFINTETMRRHAPLPSKISCRAESYNDLNMLIRNPTERSGRHRAANVCATYIKPWFGNVDGGAAARVAASLMEVAQGTEGRVRSSIIHSLWGSRSSANAGRLAFGLVGSILGTYMASRLGYALTPARKTKDVTAREIRARIEAFIKLGGFDLPFQCRRALHPFTRLPLTSIELRPQA